MDPVSPLTAVLIECAVLARQSADLSAIESSLMALKASLADIFGTLAEALAANPKWESWVADSSNPGYLVATIDDMEIRAPWNLLADFPPATILRELLTLAKDLRSGKETAICLSGSSTLYSSLGSIGDIDFCEYVDASDQKGLKDTEDRSFARTVRRAAALVDGPLLCIGLKILALESPLLQGIRRSRPWIVSPEQDKIFLSQAQRALAGKCDFIADSPSQGVLELTNLVLFIDAANSDHGSGERSFPAQEAVIPGVGGWVPRRLAQPLALGRYINWLRDEVEQQARADMPDASLGKAAKRALSLARILFLGDAAEVLIELIRENKLSIGSALCSRLALRKRVQRMSSDPAMRQFETPLARTLRKLIAELDDPTLMLPNGDLDSEWCASAEAHLESSSRDHAVVRTRILQFLENISGRLYQGFDQAG